MKTTVIMIHLLLFIAMSSMKCTNQDQTVSNRAAADQTIKLKRIFRKHIRKTEVVKIVDAGNLPNEDADAFKDFILSDKFLLLKDLAGPCLDEDPFTMEFNRKGKSMTFQFDADCEQVQFQLDKIFQMATLTSLSSQKLKSLIVRLGHLEPEAGSTSENEVVNIDDRLETLWGREIIEEIGRSGKAKVVLIDPFGRMNPREISPTRFLGYQIIEGPYEMDKKDCKKLNELTLDTDSYYLDEYGKSCLFSPIFGVEYRDKQSQNKVNMLICLTCNLLKIVRGGEERSEDIDPARSKILDLFKPYFPNHTNIQSLN